MTLKKALNSINVVNVTEEVALSILLDLAEQNRLGCCICNQCILDVLAIILTNTPAQYSVPRKDFSSPNKHLQIRMLELKIKIIEALPSAVLNVKKYPHHCP